MILSRVVFDEVALRELRRGRCTRCGKRRARVYRVWQTVNPFNVNELGTPKNREEILMELRAELAQKTAAPFVCSSCEVGA